MFHSCICSNVNTRFVIQMSFTFVCLPTEIPPMEILCQIRSPYRVFGHCTEQFNVRDDSRTSTTMSNLYVYAEFADIRKSDTETQSTEFGIVCVDENVLSKFGG